jgi:pyrroline-5-carboxylate reductase
MGGIILEGVLKNNIFETVEVVEPSESPVLSEHRSKGRITVHTSIPDGVRWDVALVCVKPWLVQNIVCNLEKNRVKIIASIAAGISLADLQSYNSPGYVPFVRVMPNTPCQVGEGMTAIVPGPNSPPELVQKLKEIFLTMGKVVEFPDERLIDAFTALCGSGPGLMLTIIEAFADAGLYHGIPKKQAVEMVAQTMLGTAKMVLETGEHPATLRDQVCTPGGFTIAGVNKLHDEGVPGSLIKSVGEMMKRLCQH